MWVGTFAHTDFQECKRLELIPGSVRVAPAAGARLVAGYRLAECCDWVVLPSRVFTGFGGRWYPGWLREVGPFGPGLA